MSEPLSTLRAEAEVLTRQLPDLMIQADAADLVHPGAAGRKRAGSGEQFWQYRRYAQTDAADRIDWRRSARGDEYFVRETELETARTVLFWCDGEPGFDWASEAGATTKAARARVLMLSLGLLLARQGERIGVLNGPRPAALGKAAPDRLAEDLITLMSAGVPLTPPRSTSLAIIASDFYTPMPVWEKHLSALAQTCRQGVLLCVSDPAEHEFAYTGRVRLRAPGSALERLFGRAETVRERYLARFAERQEALQNLAARLGWALVRHRTDDAALGGAAAVLQALGQFGGKA